MLKINTLKQEQLPLLFHYSRLENWSVEELHGLCQYKLYPNDFFIASKQEQLIGFILAMRHNASFGFISNFIIVKEFRGQGYGKKLFSHALKHLGTRQIALDSIKGKEKFYQSFGFQSYFDVSVVKFINGSVTLPSSVLTTIDCNKQAFLQEMDAHMQCLILNKTVHCKAIKQGGKMSSYGVLFSYNNGYKIVLVSEDINEAITLFFDLTKELQKGVAIYMQVTQLEPLLQTVEELLTMKVQLQYSRMYNKIID